MGIQAYKDSEVGRIPRDWSVKQIGKIGYTYSGLTGKGKNDFGKGNSRYITFLNVLNNPVLRTDIFERVSVSEGEHQNLALKGDLFFNTSSETPEEVGICALLDEDVPNLYLNSFCFGYRLTDPEVDGLFLSYFFRSKAGRDIMTMLAQGATRYNLSKESFNKSLIAFPPFEEQKKIAEALSGVDDMIGALDEAISKKRQIKEGLMQQLLTGKTRLPGFSGEWQKKRVGDIGFTYSGLTGKTKNDFGHGEAQYITFLNVLNNPVLKTDIFEKVDVRCDERQNAAKKGDLFFNTSSETPEEVGICALLNADIDNLYLNSFCFGFRLTDPDVDGLYLSYYWRSKQGREIMSALAQGATRYNLSKEYFNKAIIALPPIELQKYIANTITAADKEIEGLEQKRGKYLLVKQGMMQELLTGKTRLV